MLSSGRTYDMSEPTIIVPHLEHPAIADGVEDAVNSKNISPAGLLFANRRIGTMERPLHSLGQKFVIDRSSDTLSPADCQPNRPATAQILAGIARPELPPAMFGM